MDREPLEHAEGNGLAFGSINDVDDDIEAGSPQGSTTSTSAKIKSLLCPRLSGAAQSHELESLVPGDGNPLDEERRSTKPHKARKYIKSGLCIVFVSLIIYVSIALAILYTAGKKIEVGYNGGLVLELTCDSEQRITALIEFNNIQSLDLVVDEPKLKFNDWGELVPNTSIVVKNGVLSVTGTMTVLNELSLSNFLTHYIGWRLNNTASQPTIDVGISGKLATSLFPFRIPFSVSNSVGAPRTNTSFIPSGINASQTDSDINILFNCTSDGLHAWHHKFDLGFVSDTLQVTATTSYYNNTDQQTLLVKNTQNGTAFGIANAINTILTNRTILPAQGIHITGLPGPCLANRIMSKVDIYVRYSFIDSALGHLNMSKPEDESLKVSLVKATIENSRETGIDVDADLEIENVMPIRISGLESTRFMTSDGSISSLRFIKDLTNTGTGISVDFNSEQFSTNFASSIFNTLSIQPIEGGVCLQSENTTWLGTFINGLDKSFRCITDFQKTSKSPGYGLWQALLQPHWYIEQMKMLPLTDRHVDVVGSDFVHLKTVQMLLPVSTIQIYPFTTISGIPNIEISGSKKVTAVSTGSAFNSDTRCWLDESSMLHIGVNFTKTLEFGDLLTGAGSRSDMTINIADWEIKVPLLTPSWNGVLSIEDIDGKKVVAARNRFPVDLFLEGGQHMTLGGKDYGKIPSEGVTIPMHSIARDGANGTTKVVIPTTADNTTSNGVSTVISIGCSEYHTKSTDSPTICPGDDPTDPDNLCQQDGIDQICLFSQSDVCSADITVDLLIYDVCPQQCTWCDLVGGTALKFHLP
eukprot:TRINITY_DN9337_c1_g1_i1.p1 TRINITY_DN9337_c1_g1~~TRINITY_DN9337_c1_g1_i1.p1  ORF type:complete len:812 (+),score=141.32 TRINITY_DN9337_c1_g1_i1:47-2482(+)